MLCRYSPGRGHRIDDAAVLMSPDRIISLLDAESKDQEQPQVAAAADLLLSELATLAPRVIADVALAIETTRASGAGIFLLLS